MVAKPGLPTNGVSVGEVEGTPIQQSIIGSCSGAFYHDLVQAADIVKGRKIHPRVRFMDKLGTGTLCSSLDSCNCRAYFYYLI